MFIFEYTFLARHETWDLKWHMIESDYNALSQVWTTHPTCVHLLCVPSKHLPCTIYSMFHVPKFRVWTISVAWCKWHGTFSEYCFYKCWFIYSGTIGIQQNVSLKSFARILRCPDGINQETPSDTWLSNVIIMLLLLPTDSLPTVSQPTNNQQYRRQYYNSHKLTSMSQELFALFFPLKNRLCFFHSPHWHWLDWVHKFIEAH